ncbi:MAG: nuclear transport factor 2 family protein, partial [Candidatus Dadabacteria bacterium]|nr:nuclear transport factor 2 family protein [Candidatus Dadabacteria bacterium]
MSEALKTEAIAIVERFMLASMDGDRAVTDELMAPDIKITFVGGRKFDKPEDIKSFNSERFRDLKKKIERYDVAFEDNETTVYCIGTLYGEWPDGEPFEGNRYVDRFVIRD